jgi:hypothetical protein
MCLGSAPAAPAPPPPPIQPPAAAAPAKRTDEAVVRSRQIERNRAALAQGRSSALLTTNQQLGAANTTGKTLLGQ